MDLHDDRGAGETSVGEISQCEQRVIERVDRSFDPQMRSLAAFEESSSIGPRIGFDAQQVLLVEQMRLQRFWRPLTQNRQSPQV